MANALKTKGPDNIDKRILQALKQNARTTVADISRKIHLSAPAVADRISRMEEDGIIKGYSVDVDYSKIGLPVQAFITFKLVRKSHTEFLKWIKTFPEILDCHIVTGDPGAFLKVAVDSTGNLGKLIDKLKEYGETNTAVILNKHI